MRQFSRSVALVAFVVSFSLAAEERAVSPYQTSPRLGLKIAGAAAGGTDGFLATWFEWSDRLRLFGARLTPEGRLAGSPFFIGDAPAQLASVRAVGNRYIVTSDTVNPFAPDTITQEPLMAWEVSPAGVGPISVERPRVENASGEHLVVTFGETDMAAAIVDRNGVFSDTVRSSEVHASRVLQAMPFGDDWVFLTASDDGRVQWVRLSRAGIIRTTVVREAQPQQSAWTASDVVTSGSELAFAWSEISPVSGAWERRLGYTVVNADSGAFHETRVDSTRMQSSGTYAVPAALFNGREFVYAWTWFDDARPAELRIVHGTGAPRVLARHPASFPVDLHPLLAAGTNGDLVLWHPLFGSGSPNNRTDIFARVVNETSSIDDGVLPALVTAGVSTQRLPRQAAGPGGTFIAWLEGGAPLEVRGRFFPSAGAPGEPFTIYGGHSSLVTLAANANTFLVAWRDSSSPPRLFFRRYDEHGAPVDDAPVALDSGYGGPLSVIDDGDSFVVAWSIYAASFAARIPSRGAVEVARKQIMEQPLGDNPQLVRLGGRILALWLSAVYGPSFVLKVAPLRETLTLDSATNVWLFSQAAYPQVRFAASGTDRELMVVLVGRSCVGGRDCISARRFGGDLSALEDADANILDSKLTPFVVPDVAWDGARWWVSYSDLVESKDAVPVWLFGSGAAAPLVTSLRFAQPALDVSFVRTPAGMSATYARADANAALTFRAFQVPVVTLVPRTRGARH